MTEISVNKEYAESADAVWKVLADFGGIAAWGPGIEASRNQGEGIGMVRVLTMKGGMEMHERLEALDESARSLSYAIIGGPMPVENYLATVTVSEAGAGCRVDWGARFDSPEGVPGDAIGDGVKGAYSGMLEALQRKLAEG